MPATVFGPGSSVIKMNLALGQGVPSNAIYQNQLAQATANEFAYANAIANTVYGAGVTNLAFATAVLTNLGAGAQAAAGLAQAVADYISNVVGTANRGAVALQLTNILSNLEGDVTYGPIASNFNSAVSSGFLQATGTNPTPGSTFSFTNNGNDALNGTAGNDTFTGNTATVQQGESINAGAGNDTAVLSLSGGLYDNFIASDLERIVLNGSGNGTLTFEVSNVGGLQSVGVANRSAGNVEIKDVQSNTVTLDLTDVQGDVLFQLDQQKAQGATETKVSINEFSGALSVQGENGETIETLSLTVDPTEPFTSGKLGSVLKSVTATNNETLNIAGGSTGKGFKITGPLDSTLKVVNASTFAGDLDLNATANGAEQALAVTLGSGNDKLNMGDGYGDGDVINGGAGADQVTVNFTTITDPTRAAAMTKVETLNATFNNAVSFEGGLVDDLKTINLAASTSRADFNQMDSTLDTLNITGNASQGVEVDFDGVAFAKLDVNITDKTSAIGNAGNKASIRVINADTVALNHNGTANVVLSDGIQVDDTFTGRHTSTLSITNNSTGNLTINSFGPTVIRDGNTVANLSITSTNLGDIQAGAALGTGAFLSQLMGEADGLQSFTVKTSLDSDVALGSVGTGLVGADGGAPAADDLESVSFDVGVSSELWQYGIDADDTNGLGLPAATVTSISIKGADSSLIHLLGNLGSDLNADGNLNRTTTTGGNWLQAASIGLMTINSSGLVLNGGVTFTQDTNNGGATDIQAINLIGLDLEGVDAGSKIVVSGSAPVTGLYFHDETVSVVDASGLTANANTHVAPNFVGETLAADGNAVPFNAIIGLANHDAQYSFAVIASDELNGPAGVAYQVLGSAGDDFITGTKVTGAGDNLAGNAGNDLILGYAGNDTISGGDGNDVLFGDDFAAQLGGLESGNDIIDGGAGNDLIIGGQNVAGAPFGDMLTGGAGNDGFVFHITARPAETGKSTASIRPDAITDFTPGADTIFLDNAAAQGSVYDMVYYTGPSAAGIAFGATNNISGDELVVVRRGDYDLNTGTFNVNATGADFQVLFHDNGVTFTAAELAVLGGFGAFAPADVQEIALLGVANKVGSLNTTDIQFV